MTKQCDVAVYLCSANTKDPRKQGVLQAFSAGAKRYARSVIEVRNRNQLVRAKLAVILGWHSPYSNLLGVNLVRRNIIEFQKSCGNRTMAIDAGCWKYCDPENRFLRYSLDGVFYDRHEYANKNSTSERYEVIAKALNLDLKPWKKNGDKIVLLMQRNFGWSMKGTTPIQWVVDKVKQIREHTDRPIVVRPHPVATEIGEIISLTQIPGISISDYRTIGLIQNLDNAFAAAVFNSSSGVAALMNGVPLFVDDESSVCYQASNKDVSKINNPEYPNREQWLYDLAACHWSDEEVRQGLVYKKFLPYL